MSQALLVAIEYEGKLRLASAANEIEVLRGLCTSIEDAPVDPALAEPASVELNRCKQHLMSYLPKCKVFHFAGHGYTDNEDSSKSHLLLGDKPGEPNSLLTVANLLELNLRENTPFLAYLSACGTARIKSKRFLDENIHLISAFQLLGFRHVIGTLWEVNDDFCVDVARLTYEGMRDGGLTDESVAQGLYNAIRTLRDRWLDSPRETRPRKVSSGKRDIFSARIATADPSVSKEKRTNDSRPRDGSLSSVDDNSDEGAVLLESGLVLWVPYVYFGV